jgi:VanZ family protein
MSSTRILQTWLICLLLTVVGSLMPRSIQTKSHATIVIGDPVERTTGLSDKPQHFLVYALLAYLPAVGFHKKVVGFSAGASMALFGVALEIFQLLTHDRMFEAADMSANAFGVAAGLLLAAVSAIRVEALRRGAGLTEGSTIEPS